ncbi:hypothetical protein [Sphingomonas sp. Leaf17]|uniref:hypothetical protein n=1 Tax=Sphingomonas sp. Leaf17 TaxID=1735683 RepID=UPI000B2A6DAB|nr:hypothetical protein [Sphingomonas sp. Leaf17]
MLAAALLFATLQPPEPTLIAELPQPVLSEVSSAITECKSALTGGGIEFLEGAGWKRAKLKKASILGSDVKGLMAKGSDAPLIEFKQSLNGLYSCTVWGRIDRKKDVSLLTSAIVTALPAKSNEKIMAAYLFAGEDALAAMNLRDSNTGPIFNIGIFPVKRGKK